jgi:hypothetical protein
LGTVSKSVLSDFDHLITIESSEAAYHQYFASHPVLIDPLAAVIISKQQLGLEHVTDFAVRRHDGDYILVEIEKPQDRLFTTSNDYSAAFAHAFGQVVDFEQWVRDHGDYARHLMPGISSPRGMLIIGRSHEFSVEMNESFVAFARIASE